MNLPLYIFSFKQLLFEDRFGRFVVAVALFVLTVVAIDRALTLLKPPGDSIFARITTQKQAQVDQRVGAGLSGIDVVAIGSSRAQFSVSPKVFEDVTGMRGYNAGIGGFVETNRHFDLLKRILKRSDPKLIVYVVDDFALNAGPRASRDGELLHMFQSVRLLRKGLPNAILSMARDDWRIPAYKKVELNKKWFDQYDGYEIHSDGWVEGRGTPNTQRVRRKGEAFSPDPDAVTLFRQLVAFSKNRSVPIVLVLAPTHRAYLEKGETRVRQYVAFMNALATELDVPFFNFTDPARFPVADDLLFFDTSHLNTRGAELFSRSLADAVLPALKGQASR
jgi:hypothetical protein